MHPHLILIPCLLLATPSWGASAEAPISMGVTREILVLALVALVGGAAWVFTLRARLKREQAALQALKASEQRWRLMFENNSDPIMLLDMLTGNFIEANRAVVALLGFERREEILNLQPWAISPPFQPDGSRSDVSAFAIMERVARNGNERFEWMHARKDGVEVPSEVSVTAVQVGEQPLAICIVRDITERKKAEAKILELNTSLEHRVAQRTAELKAAEEELSKALAAERELSKLKTNFVSMVSHEFRTPLGIISVASELIHRYRDRLKPEQMTEHLASIINAVRRMTGMMENILVLSRVDTDRLECKPVPLNLPSLCHRLVDEMQSVTNRSHQIRLTVEGGNVEADARVDEAVLRHVLANLLSNACKYSPADQPVDFTLRREDSSAVLIVRDRGIGIPEHDLDRLFQSFHRGANVGQVPGTGIGLVIVKRCVDLHGGTIVVDSSEDTGATFTVRVPVW